LMKIQIAAILSIVLLGFTEVGGIHAQTASIISQSVPTFRLGTMLLPALPQSGDARLGTVRIVDSRGRTLGPSLDGATVILRVGTSVFNAFVGKSGFRDTGGAFYHTSTDCSGPRYSLATNPESFITGGYSDGKQVFLAGTPTQQMTFNSQEYYNPTFTTT